MSLTILETSASAEEVWAVLADPSAYEDWVVGASDIRDADPSWPAPGSTFHHTQGVPHVGLKDSSSVIESEAPRRLVLEVRARPLLINIVELTLEPAPGGGTAVRMFERPKSGPLARVWNPLLDRMQHARNAEGLRRLTKLAVERSARPAAV